MEVLVAELPEYRRRKEVLQTLISQDRENAKKKALILEYLKAGGSVKRLTPQALAFISIDDLDI